MKKRIDWRSRIVVADDGCWNYTGPRDSRGYGRHAAALVHRLAYVAAKGPVPRGLELDHLCRNPACANPDHLEAVTHAVNVKRGIVGAVNRARLSGRTHCKKGHAFTAENTGRDHRGHRYCRACSTALHRSYYHQDIERSRTYVRNKQRQRRSQ